MNAKRTCKNLTTSILVFYPYFPKYRRQILRELISTENTDVTIAAGTTGRASISPLSKEDLPELNELREFRLGPLSLNPGLLRRANLRNYEAVVIAPATLSVTAWTILIARWLTGRRTFLWGQCGRPGERGLKRLAQELMNRMATGLLVYGEMEKNSACELGTPSEKVSVVHNANDHYRQIENWSSGKFTEIAHSRGIGSFNPKQKVRLLYIGRVTAGKKLERLIESLGILRDKGYDVEATIIGEGEALDSLKDTVLDNALPITFTGGLHSDEELQPYLDAATLVVAPNSIGLLAIDALNNGIPVIYPADSEGNGPEHEALTEGLTALSFSGLSGAAIARAIERWLELSPRIDVAAYEAAVRHSSKKWHPQTVAQRISETIRASVHFEYPAEAHTDAPTE